MRRSTAAISNPPETALGLGSRLPKYAVLPGGGQSVRVTGRYRPLVGTVDQRLSAMSVTGGEAQLPGTPTWLRRGAARAPCPLWVVHTPHAPVRHAGAAWARPSRPRTAAWVGHVVGLRVVSATALLGPKIRTQSPPPGQPPTTTRRPQTRANAGPGVLTAQETTREQRANSGRNGPLPRGGGRPPLKRH